MKPYHVLLVEEVLHPFYIFQIISVTFWMVDAYYYYSGTSSSFVGSTSISFSPPLPLSPPYISLPLLPLSISLPLLPLSISLSLSLSPSLPSPSPTPTAAVFLISSVSVLVSLVQTRRHLQQLHDMAAQSSSLSVIREGRGIRLLLRLYET